MEEEIKEAETEKVETMDFYEALKEATIGKRIQRLEWHDSEYGIMVSDILHIHKNDKDHQWIISYGDLTATDWISF